MQVRVKICGITSAADAIAAVEAGADALGFVFYEKSPRYVTPAQAVSIMQSLPPFISRVGLFVDAPVEAVNRIVAETGIDTLQFHGDEPPELCRQFRQATLKAIRVRGPESLRNIPHYPVTGILLDSFVAGNPGGTGVQFKWNLAIEAKRMGRPIILAGGLTPATVAEAVRFVNPYGVDVSSGVESVPGRKDVAKLRDFVAAAKGAR